MYVLVLKGVLLGTVSALFHHEGTLLHLYTFVLPHGVVELARVPRQRGSIEPSSPPLPPGDPD